MSNNDLIEKVSIEEIIDTWDMPIDTWEEFLQDSKNRAETLDPEDISNNPETD
jgi:hypothetical protein